MLFIALFALSFLPSDRGRSFSMLLLVLISLYHVFMVSTFSSSIVSSGDMTILGNVVGNPGMTGKRKSSFDVEVKLLKDEMGFYGSGKGRVHVISKEEEIYSGDVVVLSGRFLDDELFFSDGVVVRNHGYLYSFRRRCLGFIRGRVSVLSEDVRELSLRLLLGSGDAATYEIGEMARAKGVSHVFALSGMHLEIIFNFASLALIFIPSDETRGRMVLVPLVLFSFLSSFGASLLRALLMRALKAVFPKLSMDETLCFAFVIHAYISPMMILSAGGSLSYMSIAAILLLSKWTENLGGISSSFLITSGCLLSTGFYSMRTFDSFTLSGLLYSPLVSFVVRIFMTLLLVLVILPLPFIPWLLDLVYRVLLHMLNLPDILGCLGFDVAYMSTAAVFMLLLSYSCGQKKGFGLCFQHCVEPELRKHK